MTSGATWRAVVTAVQIGQNATLQTTALSACPSTGGTSCTGRGRVLGSATSASLRSGAGWARERDLEMVADEVRAPDLEPLQRLRQDEVPLVGADADEQLVALAVDVHVLARDERQPHHEHVA